MRQDEVFQGRFMRAADLRNKSTGEYGTLVATITDVSTSEKFDDGTTKRVISFKEHPKPLALGKTTWKQTAKATGEEDDEHWPGKRIELWVDENVEYAGDTVPGIRIRKAPGAANGVVAALKQATGATSASDLPLATKSTAWAAWKRAASERGDAAPDLADRFKKAADIEAANSKTPIDNFGAVQWGNVAQAYRSASEVIDEADIPF